MHFEIFASLLQSQLIFCLNLPDNELLKLSKYCDLYHPFYFTCFIIVEFLVVTNLQPFLLKPDVPKPDTDLNPAGSLVKFCFILMTDSYKVKSKN